MADALPSDIPAEVVDAAMDTLGGALEVAQTLPAELASALVAAAQTAFIDAIHFVAAVAAVLVVVTAIAAAAALGRCPPGPSQLPKKDSRRSPWARPTEDRWAGRRGHSG